MLPRRDEAAGPGPAPGSTVAGSPAVVRPVEASEITATQSQSRPSSAARAAIRMQAAADVSVAKLRSTEPRGAVDGTVSTRPWYETRRMTRTAPGRRQCGLLEGILHREWTDAEPAPAVVTAIDRLADLPQLIKEKLAAGLDAIHVGAGGVPDLDDMERLRGVPLPSGRATWDACAGAYGARKIIVGSRLSPTPDVMCHEIGHALDDIDGPGDQWQSDLPEFHRLYGRCRPRMASSFHCAPGALGRREFFADAFAAIASAQRPALVDMLSGDTRAALDVMLYFNVRYGI
jgi:hypothetical protein